MPALNAPVAGRRAIVFFDIDGTLLDHRKRLPGSAKEAIQALQDLGHEVALATGRSPFMLQRVAEELGIDSYIGFNGQYVVMKGSAFIRTRSGRKNWTNCPGSPRQTDIRWFI